MDLFDAVAIAALLGAIISIGIRAWETPPALLRRLELLEVDLQEAIDRMTTWMKRENVRRARDSKEQESRDEAAVAPPVGTEIDRLRKKAQIRARMHGGRS